MDSKRILLLEQNTVQADAIGELILRSGHLVVGPVHSLEEALRRVDRVDAAVLQRDLGEGLDATPVAEALATQGKKYAFLIEPGDLTDQAAFPAARFIRKPLTQQAVDALLEALTFERTEPDLEDPHRESEIDLFKRKIQDTAVRAGPDGED